jgi:choline kinase
MRTLVVPMVGEGKRMKDIFAEPKPFIELNGRRIVALAVESALSILDFSSIVYLIRAEHEVIFKAEIYDNLPAGEIQIYNENTRGPAHTLHIAKILPEESFFSVDCDLFFSGAEKKDFKFGEQEIQTFWSESNNPAHSFIEEKSGLVLNIVEKEMISNKGVVGFYGFKSKKFFDQLYAATNFDKEHFVSNVIKTALLENKIVHTSRVDSHTPLGTPNEYLQYLKSPKNWIQE